MVSTSLSSSALNVLTSILQPVIGGSLAGMKAPQLSLSKDVSRMGDGIYGDLLQAQMRAQQELQVFSSLSNVERSKHETRMSVINNLRVR